MWWSQGMPTWRKGPKKRSGQKSRLSVGLFDFNFLVLNILKEADINFFFKVLAKFGNYKHNKDIKKNCGKKWVFFIEGGWGNIWMENSITFNETFPKTPNNKFSRNSPLPCIFGSKLFKCTYTTWQFSISPAQDNLTAGILLRI